MQENTTNMYNWITKTWNPIRGKCGFGCVYCYVKNSRAKHLYENPPALIESAFKPLGTGKTIFVCSMIDIFGPSIETDWILKTFCYCRNFANIYLFQSKNPIHFFEFTDYFPKKIILATTIETNRDYKNTSAPTIYQRMNGLAMLRSVGYDTMVTIEPIMDFDLEEMLNIIREIKPQFVNIGADSKRNNLPEPSWRKTSILIDKLREFTEVKIKSNLERLQGAPSACGRDERSNNDSI